MKVSKVIFGCIALVGVIEVDVVSSMESLTSTQSISNNKTQGAEDALAEQKKIIDGLIPNLLNNENSEPRTYDKDKVQELFGILLKNRSKRLCYYTQTQFVSRFLGDIFALECGVSGTIRQISDRIPFNLCPSIEFFMKDFEFRFSLTYSTLSDLQNTIYDI